MATQTYYFQDVFAGDAARDALCEKFNTGKFQVQVHDRDTDKNDHKGYVVVNDKKQAVGYFEYDGTGEDGFTALRRIDISDINLNFSALGYRSEEAQIISGYVNPDAGPAPIAETEMFKKAVGEEVQRADGKEASQLRGRFS